MTGGGNDLAALQLGTAALAAGVAGVAIFRTGGVLSVLDFGAAGVVVLIQFAVGLPAHLAHGLVLAGGCAALVTGGGDDLAALQLVAAVLAVGVAGVAVYRAGGILGVLDLGAAGVVVLIQLAIGLLAHLTHGLVLAGGCAALVTGGGDDLAALQLVAAVLAVGIAGIAVFRTGGVLSVPDLGAAGMLAVGGLPAQHGIAAVDIAQIPLEAVTQRGGHGLGL